MYSQAPLLSTELGTKWPHALPAARLNILYCHGAAVLRVPLLFAHIRAKWLLVVSFVNECIKWLYRANRAVIFDVVRLGYRHLGMPLLPCQFLLLSVCL